MFFPFLWVRSSVWIIICRQSNLDSKLQAALMQRVSMTCSKTGCTSMGSQQHFPHLPFFLRTSIKGNQSQVHQLASLFKNKQMMTLHKLFLSHPSLHTDYLIQRPQKSVKTLTQTSKGSIISPFFIYPFQTHQYFMQHIVFNKSGAIRLQSPKHFPVINSS